MGAASDGRRVRGRHLPVFFTAVFTTVFTTDGEYRGAASDGRRVRERR